MNAKPDRPAPARDRATALAQFVARGFYVMDKVEAPEEPVSDTPDISTTDQEAPLP